MSSTGHRIAGLVAGRRTKFVVLGLWVVAALALAPLAGRFESVQENEASSFLPAEAESVAVLESSDGFASGDVTTAIVVLRQPGGLDDDVLTAVTEAIDVASIEGVADLPPPVISEDGTAALVTVPIEAGGEEEVLIDAVGQVREILGRTVPDGVEARVTGPAGFSADASEVFEGINSTLLFVTAGLVFVLLVLIYRSPVFWILPLFSVLVAEFVVRGLGTFMAEGGLIINGQTGGILLILVFGAGTDYALLLTARYREELHRVEDRHEAMRIALVRAGPAILASAGTVVAALLCLSLAEVNSISGLGPVGAMGVAVAALAMLTLLPVLLLVGGRRVFWPFVPRVGSDDRSDPGFWRRLGKWIERRHRAVWIATTLALAVMALGAVTLDDDLTTANAFRGSVESVQGQRLLEEAFPAGAGAPTVVLVRDESQVDSVLAAAESSPDVASVGDVERGEPGARFDVVLVEAPYTEEAYAVVPRLRSTLREAGDSALVGGASAEEADLRAATRRDTRVLVPLVLAVVVAILVLLLRALVAPLLLMATVVLSYFAALGGSLVLLELFTDFPGEDPSFPLLAFIFLVALGVDYNIFLMARVREEAFAQPTRGAMLEGLAATGGVITSAGVVLAGTFAVLAVLPLVALTQIGITVAFGVLLDTLVVRSILVPALTFDTGSRIWWPSALSRLRWNGATAKEAAQDVDDARADQRARS